MRTSLSNLRRMTLKTQIDHILNQKMDRQGFLRHVLLGMVVLLGFGTMLRMLNAEHGGRAALDGYSNAGYGGNNEPKAGGLK